MRVTLPRQKLEEVFCIKLMLQKTDNILGDIGEIGVANGGTAYLMSSFLKQGEAIHLFDTWNGPPCEYLMQDEYHWEDKFKNCRKSNVEKLLQGKNYETHEGVFIAETAPKLSIRFLHIDVDTEFGTSEALKWCGQVMVPGSIVVLHDYNGRNTPGVKRAVDAYLLDSHINSETMPIPSSQIVLYF